MGIDPIGMSNVGTQLSARYELRRVLGHGGMGQVFLARDRLLERPVAVKVLSPPFDRDEAFVERFRREARSAAGLSHPNIVAVFDTGSEGGTHFIVMEYVDGPTLAEVIGRDGPMPPDRVAAIGASIAEALGAAHRQGVIHRDVKPGNVMLAAGGEVKVLDFGIAKAADASFATHTGALMGTAAYLSPEQASGRPADARSDVYSLGCVLYELLTGRPPFRAESPMATLFQHVYEPPRPPSQLRPGVSEALDRLLMRCLQKEPERRHADATALATDLGALVTRGGDTRPLEIVEEPTVPIHGVPAAVVSPSRADAQRAASASRPRGAPSRERPRARHASATRRLAWPLALLAVAALLVVVAVAMGWPGAGGTSAGRPDRRSPGPTAQDVPPDVPQSYSALVGAIASGRLGGTVDERASEDLMHRAEEALRSYQDGDLEQALATLAVIPSDLSAFVGSGEVSRVAARQIRSAASDLAAAMRTAPPPADTGGPPPEPPGHAKDHGHGQDGGDED